MDCRRTKSNTLQGDTAYDDLLPKANREEESSDRLQRDRVKAKNKAAGVDEKDFPESGRSSIAFVPNQGNGEPQSHSSCQKIRSKQNEEGIAHVLSQSRDGNCETEKLPIIQSRRKEYKCSQCNYVNRCKWKLARHEQTHAESNSREKFSCVRCPGQFGTRNNLNRHMQIHKRKSFFPCDRCPSSFRSRIGLGRHYVVHGKALGGDLLSCAHCSAMFTRMHNLLNHMVIHAKENPFICFLCPFGFTTEEDLSQLLRAHEIDQTHKESFCMRCSFKSSEIYRFIKHVKIHEKN